MRQSENHHKTLHLWNALSGILAEDGPVGVELRGNNPSLHVFQITVCWRSPTCRLFCLRGTRQRNMTFREDMSSGETHRCLKVCTLLRLFEWLVTIKGLTKIPTRYVWTCAFVAYQQTSWALWWNFSSYRCKSTLSVTCPSDVFPSCVSARAQNQVAATLCSRKCLRWESNIRRSSQSCTRNEERSVACSYTESEVISTPLHGLSLQTVQQLAQWTFREKVWCFTSNRLISESKVKGFSGSFWADVFKTVQLWSQNLQLDPRH